jgi:hypothetical protein
MTLSRWQLCGCSFRPQLARFRQIPFDSTPSSIRQGQSAHRTRIALPRGLLPAAHRLFVILLRAGPAVALLHEQIGVIGCRNELQQQREAAALRGT